MKISGIIASDNIERDPDGWVGRFHFYLIIRLSFILFQQSKMVMIDLIQIRLHRSEHLP